MAKTRAGFLGGADPTWVTFQMENRHQTVVYYRRTYNTPYESCEPGTPIFLCRRGAPEVSLNLVGQFAEHRRLDIDASWTEFGRLLGAPSLEEFREQAVRILGVDTILSVARIDDVVCLSTPMPVSVAGVVVKPGVLQSGKWLEKQEVTQLFEAVRRLGEASVESLPSDFEESDNETIRARVTTLRVLRDTQLSRQLKQMHDNTCQVCGEALSMGRKGTYSEAHHIKPLGRPHNGPDVAENILVLCPNHHAQCDYGAIRLDHSKLREAEGHHVGQQFIDYHNEKIVGAK